MRQFSREETDRWLRGLDRRVASAFAWLETSDGRLVVVKSDYKTHWSLPGGLVDPGETPLDAAYREVREEIGISLPPDTLAFAVVASVPSHTLGLYYHFIFSADIPDEQLKRIELQSDEIEAYKLVTKTQVLSGDLPYSEDIVAWARGTRGYVDVNPAKI